MSKNLTKIQCNFTCWIHLYCYDEKTQQQTEKGRGMMQIQWVRPLVYYCKLTRNGLMYIFKYIEDNFYLR